MTTAQLLSTLWEADSVVLVVCAIAVVLYAAFVRRGKTAFFAAAIVVFVVALASPIGVLARGYLFSAHMLQHLLLVLVVPPLVWLALPHQATPRVRALDPKPKPGPRFLEPWILGLGAMWLWHAPTLCDAAGRSLGIQRVQTLSLLAMGAAFWWPILAPRAAHRLAPFGAMLYLFTACVGCTILGIVVTFSPIEICSIYAHPVDRLGVMPLLRDRWGMSTKADQEIGGLMMWVPACLVYAAGILAMLARYYRDDDAPALDAAPAPGAIGASERSVGTEGT